MIGSHALTIRSCELDCVAPRAWAVTVWRSLILALLVSVIFLPEFSREGNAGFTSYAKVAGGFRLIDLAILALLLVHLAALGCIRGKVVRLPQPLIAPAIGFLGCIALAIYYGKTHGGRNLFFDWRGLALGVALFVVWSYWLRDAVDVNSAVHVFAAYMAVRIALLYASFLAGDGETLLGIVIPIFDGPVLSCIVFAGLLAFCYKDRAAYAGHKLLWSCLALSAYLIVLMCFRRTYWGELAIGTLILLLLQSRHRLRNLVLLLITIGAAFVMLGAPFSSRIQSLDPTREDTQFSSDNADHLYDLVDAWSQVRQSPVMGVGLGTSYSTWHIRRWKTESVMVHNAPLHVWLKYGLAGLLCYLWFHVALLRWLYAGLQRAEPADRAFLSAAFAYLAAQFVVTLGFAPWPYSELQLTTLMTFILAAAVAVCKQTPLRFSV